MYVLLPKPDSSSSGIVVGRATAYLLLVAENRPTCCFGAARAVGLAVYLLSVCVHLSR